MALSIRSPVGSPSRGGDVVAYVFDISQPSLPTPFCSVLVPNEEVRVKIQQAIETTRRPVDHGKETQTAVVWSCLPFIRFD